MRKLEKTQGAWNENSDGIITGRSNSSNGNYHHIGNGLRNHEGKRKA